MPQGQPLVVPDDAMNDETLFFERAIAIGRAPEVKLDRVRAGAITAAALQTRGVVLYWDTAPSESSIAPLTTFLSNGGGVVQLAGRRTAARGSTLSLLNAKASGTADRLADRGGSLRDLHFEHQLFAPFRETQDAFTATRLLRYTRLDAPTNADILARFDDGLPAVLERTIGAGHVIAETIT